MSKSLKELRTEMQASSCDFLNPATLTESRSYFCGNYVRNGNYFIIGKLHSGGSFYTYRIHRWDEAKKEVVSDEKEYSSHKEASRVLSSLLIKEGLSNARHRTKTRKEEATPKESLSEKAYEVLKEGESFKTYGKLLRRMSKEQLLDHVQILLLDSYYCEIAVKTVQTYL